MDVWTKLWDQAKDSGVVIDCVAELQSNLDTFDGIRADGAFVENETCGCVGASHTNEISLWSQFPG